MEFIKQLNKRLGNKIAESKKEKAHIKFEPQYYAKKILNDIAKFTKTYQNKTIVDLNMVTAKMGLSDSRAKRVKSLVEYEMSNNIQQ
jgi:hypothetical protein